jgi:hypothetical protein
MVQESREILPEGYDTLDGIYMPARKCVIDYDDWTKIVRYYLRKA